MAAAPLFGTTAQQIAFWTAFRDRKWAKAHDLLAILRPEAHYLHRVFPLRRSEAK